MWGSRGEHEDGAELLIKVLAANLASCIKGIPIIMAGQSQVKVTSHSYRAGGEELESLKDQEVHY